MHDHNAQAQNYISTMSTKIGHQCRTVEIVADNVEVVYLILYV